MAAKRQYRALVGLRYPRNPDAPREAWQWKRVAAGEVVNDIPERSIDDLLQRGRIEAVERKRGGKDDADGEVR